MLAKSEARPQGQGRILVAEDEGALREAVCDYLSGLGYTVFGAGSGQEALSLASEQEKTIDLLLTDLVMPKMSGGELSQHLGKLRPGMKTIYMSGYADEAKMRQSVPETNVSVLQKPFSLGTLARKIREVLESAEIIQ
jgi:DNA-binding NtrC family response regulator